MTNKRGSLLDRVPLDAVSFGIMALSMFLDGAYLRRYSYAGVFGGLTAYGLNVFADFAVNKLGREFVRHRLNARLSKWKRLLSPLLLVGEVFAFYFTTVFSWREASLQMPAEPGWLLWSLALFAPTMLLFLGIAQALRDGKFDAAPSAAGGATEAKSEANAPKPQAESPALPFACPHCAATFANQQAVNAHQKRHRNRANGHSPQPQPREREGVAT